MRLFTILPEFFKTDLRCAPALMLGFLLATGASVFADPPPKPAEELIQTQEKPVISARLIEQVTPDNSRIQISLSKQRGYLMLGDEVVIETPISSGKRSGMTPEGDFTILEMNKEHRSNLYGNFVDSQGRVVRAGVSTRIDPAPSGTRFVGLPMWYYLRINDDGVGLHAGQLPGYPAAHGCIRLPEEIAPLFFKNVKVGTAVRILP